jgi:L-ascorbate metabolism protein UlaG (beta-lactamase superfamily)
MKIKQRKFHSPWSAEDTTLIDLMRWLFTRKKPKWPKSIPITQLDPQTLPIPSSIRASLVGHATWLIEIAVSSESRILRILTDPIWSNYPSPVQGFGPKRSTAPGIALEKLPPIDVVLISHSHYDHLDVSTLRALSKYQNPLCLVPLGIGRIVKKMAPNWKIQEMDWSDTVVITPEISIHFEHSQHWTSRLFLDKNRVLWGTFLITTPEGSVVFIGDSAYNDKLFHMLHEKYAPIALSILPIGAYEPRWFMKPAHMNPQDAVMAHIDLHSQQSLASHFNCFPLADEGYDDAVQDLKSALTELKIPEEAFLALKPAEFWEKR